VRTIVADDDRVTAMMLGAALKRCGLDVTTVQDGQAAWEAIAAAGEPVIAVLDWMMPGIDGPDLCRRIRTDAPAAPVYALLLTSRARPADIVAGLDAGADDYLVKPFDAEELRARVRVGLRVLDLQQRLAERVQELQDAIASMKQLRGLLPMCSYCKRIRKDHGYWEQVESYISAHTDAEFSHGICPSCYEKVAPSFIGED
jgi:sigma-B regulation protein RsbU (phosphoserine phosphatase)